MYFSDQNLKIRILGFLTCEKTFKAIKFVLEIKTNHPKTVKIKTEKIKRFGISKKKNPSVFTQIPNHE